MIVTAVLLLLSLPVLAGKPFVLPALNLAVCWELLYYHISQSAGNHLTLGSSGILRDYTPEYFCCGILLFSFCILNIISKRTLYNYASENNKVFNPNFCSYLTGLIEGDGTIIVPKTLRSPKGKLNYASVQIVFHLKDLPLALLIQKELGCGSLSKKKGVNAYIFTINSYEGLYLIISILNGNMRTPKIYSLNLLIDFLNQSKGSLIQKQPLNTRPLEESA